MHHGSIPKGMEIDHINRNKSDNRIENLRAVTRSQNARNASMETRGFSGYKFVSPCGYHWGPKGKTFKTDCWKAQCTVEGITYTVSGFETAKEAYDAFMAMREKLDLEFGPDDNVIPLGAAA
jgi:hypothetical protein